MMWKYTIEVTGMMCGMCESHVNDAVRKAFPVKKVTCVPEQKRNYGDNGNRTDEAALRAAISATGYDVGAVRKELWKREGPVWTVSGRDITMERRQADCWRNF